MAMSRKENILKEANNFDHIASSNQKLNAGILKADKFLERPTPEIGGLDIIPGLSYYTSRFEAYFKAVSRYITREDRSVFQCYYSQFYALHHDNVIYPRLVEMILLVAEENGIEFISEEFLKDIGDWYGGDYFGDLSDDAWTKLIQKRYLLESIFKNADDTIKDNLLSECIRTYADGNMESMDKFFGLLYYLRESYRDGLPLTYRVYDSLQKDFKNYFRKAISVFN